jgi:hypothetical protein
MGGGVRTRTPRSKRAERSVWVIRGAPMLLVLYLAWIAIPALHQLHLHLEQGGVPCQGCPALDAGWRILSHPSDQPCSDPDHHHHSRPTHDKDHCPACQLSASSGAVLATVGIVLPDIQVAGSRAEWDVLAPPIPAQCTVSPRAPPSPLTA